MKSYISISQVREMVGGNVRDVLVYVAGIPSERCDGKYHPCPRCGGTDRFRVINQETGTCFCNQCFSEKNGDYITAVMHFQECSFSDALQKIMAYFGNSAAPSSPSSVSKNIPIDSSSVSQNIPPSSVKKGPTSKYDFSTTFTPIYHPNGSLKGMKKSCFAVGRNAWGMAFVWNGFTYVPENATVTKNSKVKKHTLYEYTDAMGEPYHLVYRIDFHNGRKVPMLFHWNGSVYVSGKGELPPIPYNTPALKEAETVFIVEGEKCAAALQWDLTQNLPKNGEIAAVTCFLDGCGAFLEEYCPWFRNKDVFIYPDNDEPGRKYARSIVENLHGIARSLHVYRWPEGTPEKWDIADEVVKHTKLSRGASGCPRAKTTETSALGHFSDQGARPPPNT